MKKKKDSIQLSKQEYYKSNENKIRNSMKVNYEENKNDKRQYRVTDPTVTNCSVNQTLQLNSYLVSIIKISIKRVTGSQVFLNITKL